MDNDRVIRIQSYRSPCGELLLGAFDDRLCLCNWVHEKHPGRVQRRLQKMLKAAFAEAPSAVTQEAARQLDEYFSGQRTAFRVPLLLAGTAFQQAVWRALADVPYGQTVSYGGLAERMGCPAAVRAVANANGANAVSIFVPCHRVIGTNRLLTGYGGGLEAKKFLLDLEHHS